MKKWWDIYSWWGIDREKLRRQMAEHPPVAKPLTLRDRVAYGVGTGLIVLFVVVLLVGPFIPPTASHRGMLTQVLSSFAGLCLIIGYRFWDRRTWRYWNMPYNQFRVEAPRPVEWRRAVIVLGLGLGILAQWRSCSGV
jgi:hypothetical protein